VGHIPAAVAVWGIVCLKTAYSICIDECKRVLSKSFRCIYDLHADRKTAGSTGIPAVFCGQDRRFLLGICEKVTVFGSLF